MKACFIRLDYLLDFHWKGRKKGCGIGKSFKTGKIHVLLAILCGWLLSSPKGIKKLSLL